MKTTILAALVLSVSLTACQKDENGSRQTDYPFVAMNNSGITGKISFIENKDSAITIVDFELNNTPEHIYMAHIHEGPPTSYHGAIYAFYPMPAANGHLSYRQNISLPYDSAMRLNCTMAVHDSTGLQDLGKCGVGINK